MRIVAIGGVVPTLGHDKTVPIREALDWQGVPPHALIIPSSSTHQAKYDKVIESNAAMFARLGVSHSVLHKFGERPTLTQIAHEIGRSTMLLVPGGNGPYLLNALRDHETGNAIKHAVKYEDKTLAGTSVGATLSGKYMHSNPATHPSTTYGWDFTYLRGLGLLDAAIGAHGDKHDPIPHGQRPDSRLENMLDTLPQDVRFGFAIDNGAALMINGDHSYPRKLVEYSQGDVHVLVNSRSRGTFAQPVGRNAMFLTQVVNEAIATAA
jgi:peptidase E